MKKCPLVYSSKKNIQAVINAGKYFIFEVSKNTAICPIVGEEHEKQATQVSKMEINQENPRLVWLRTAKAKVLLYRVKFKEGHTKAREKYFISNDLSLTSASFLDLYQRRWKIEEYHKSLKQNLGLGKCQARSKSSQINHIYICIGLFFKILKSYKFDDLFLFSLKKILKIKALNASYEAFANFCVRNLSF
jgi:hypothetical protein